MKPGLTEDWVKRIWKYSILPYVEEQFIGEPEAVERFDFDRLRRGMTESQSNEFGGIDASETTDRVD